MNRRILLGFTLVGLLAGAAAGGYWWRSGAVLSPLEQGEQAYARGDYPRAEAQARLRLKENGDDLTALRLLVRALYRQNREPQANSFRVRLPDSMLEAEDFFLLGQAYVRQGDPQSAILIWRRALGRDSNNYETLSALERAMTRLDLLNESARASRAISNLPGRRSRGQVLLARSLEEQGNPAGAAAAYAIALEKPGEWADLAAVDQVRKRYARALLQTGQAEQARKALLELPTAREDREACWLLARCDLATGATTDPAILAASRAYREQNPTAHEPAPFVGETRCIKCHGEIFRNQHASRHGRTFPRGDDLKTLPLPKAPIADPGNTQVRHEFEKRDGKIVERTTVKDRVLETVVDYAFGSGDRGLTLVGRDKANTYYEMRMSYYAAPTGWDVTSGHPQHPGLPANLYQGMVLTVDAVRRCLFCHATHPYAVLASAGPEANDRAIGCEQCHGPGSNHLIAVANKDSDLALARLTEARGAAIVGLCARCHSPRSVDLKLSPGAPDSIRFQGTTLTWSRCYSESAGMLDCVTCHDPHQDAETRASWYESRCLECHAAEKLEKNRAKPAQASLSARAEIHACPVNPRGQCVSCHMPKVKTTMSHAEFTDHFIRVHPRSEVGGRGGEKTTASTQAMAGRRP